MSFNFDRIIPRADTASVKFDAVEAVFGTTDVIPMWVADMDFAAPQAITAALIQRAAHPIYGYTLYPDSMYNALIAWLKKRHDWQIERTWITMSPGIVTALHATVLATTQPGDGVLFLCHNGRPAPGRQPAAT
jgi:cystathionine beta-lyase